MGNATFSDTPGGWDTPLPPNYDLVWQLAMQLDGTIVADQHTGKNILASGGYSGQAGNSSITLASPTEVEINDPRASGSFVPSSSVTPSVIFEVLGGKVVVTIAICNRIVVPLHG